MAGGPPAVQGTAARRGENLLGVGGASGYSHGDMRSVVLKPSVRCSRCCLPPRWCVCPAHERVTLPFAVDVLMHHRERYRPSSTGNLIERVVEDAKLHVYRRERRMTAAEVQRPGKELWILHPHGLPVPAGVDPAGVQVLLLDGAWREATAMAQEVGSWGRLVSLPMAGESRYWLRAKGEGARFSTVEALLFLIQHFAQTAGGGAANTAGLGDSNVAGFAEGETAGFGDPALHLAGEHRKLRRQFELHVYASLRSRGHKDEAQAFLAGSPIVTEMAEFVAGLDVSRPRDEARG